MPSLDDNLIGYLAVVAPLGAFCGWLLVKFIAWKGNWNQ